MDYTIYIGRELFVSLYWGGGDLVETRPTLKEDATITKVTYTAHLLQHLKGD